MAKEITGYFRTVPGGAAIAGVSVSLLHEDTGSAVPTTGGAGSGPMWKLATNPVTTDANGKFTFTCELSPGPVRVEGTSGGEKKVRSGYELMQAGGAFTSDIPLYGRLVSNGVISGLLNQLSASTTGTRQVVIATGYSVIDGYIWGIDTTRTTTHDPEATFTERWDLIVEEQYVGGTYKGRQNLAVVKGTANQADPAINADPNVKQVAIWRAKVANGATSVVLVDLRVYAGPSSLPDGLIVDADINAGAAIDATKIAAGTVDNTEFGRLNGIGSAAVGVSDSQTLTNKTLTAPAISSPTGLVKADVGLGNVDNTSDATKNAASATLTNKTLTSPVVNSPTLNSPLIAGGGTPTFVYGSGAGTGASTNAFSGSDIHGHLTINTGTSPATGANIVAITFSAALPSANYDVLLMPEDGNINGMLYTTTRLTTGFNINIENPAVAASSTITLAWLVVFYA